MTEALHQEALRTLKEVFEDRIKRYPVREGEPDTEAALASVLPMNAEEVALLSEVSERYSVPLVAQGAGTAPAPETGAEKGTILVRFDLMRRRRLPEDPGEPWAEAEPGTLWLELDDDLSARGRGLAVYPTSAPRATVGGWMAMDGLGVGSFEYGWLRENVLAADVVLPGGERREVRGEELRSFVGSGGTAGIVVNATLRTRRADADVPFAATFSGEESIVEAVAGIFEAGVPLWHLAFVNPRMSRARGLEESFLLFGAYPGERTAEVEKGIREVLESYRGHALPAAEVYRVWGERFFPVAPSHPTPSPAREVTSVTELSETLGGARYRSPYAAIQGTVARSGEVLLLALDTREEGWTR